MSNRYPTILKFKILKCDGGSHPGFQVENVFKTDMDEAYCSKKNKNVNILMKYVGGDVCTVTNFIVSTPSIDYTAPVKSGLVWFSDEPIDIPESNKYNNFTLQRFNDIDREETPSAPDVFFDTQDGYFFTANAVVNPSRKVRYVLFKLIDSFSSSNIDVGFMGLAGFDGEIELGPEETFPKVFQDFGLALDDPSKFQELDFDNSEVFGSPNTSLLIFNDEMADLGEALKAVLDGHANSDTNSGIVFWCDESNDMYETTRIYYGITEPIDILFLGKDDHQYLFSNTDYQELNGVDAIEFYERALAGDLPRYFKSEPIPTNPLSNGITHLVAHTVNDYLKNEATRKFLFVTHKFMELEDFSFDFRSLAKYLENQDIGFGIIDTESNDIDTTIFTEVPVILVINEEGAEESLVTYGGEFVIQEFLDFAVQYVDLERESFLDLLPELIEQEKKSALRNVISVEDQDTFNDFIKRDVLVIVYWTAVWCPPCKYIGPIFADYSEIFPDAVFLKLDADIHEELSDMYEIEAFPTFTFFKNNTIIDTAEGADESILLSKITHWSEYYKNE